MTDPGIAVSRLGKRFSGRTVLEQVNLQLPQQHICALLGPNGAGKTTLLRCMAGALRPDFGQCLLAGRDTTADPDAHRAFAYLPDHPPLEDELRVHEHVRLQARLRDRPPSTALIERTLERVDLRHQARQLVGNLSHGQRGRLALAECLLHEPGVLLLDEPSAGLDPAQLLALRTLLAGLRTQCCILLSTHNLTEVAAVCDSVAVLVAGRIRFQGSVEALRQQAGDLEQAYLDLAAGRGEPA